MQIASSKPEHKVQAQLSRRSGIISALKLLHENYFETQYFSTSSTYNDFSDAIVEIHFFRGETVGTKSWKYFVGVKALHPYDCAVGFSDFV